MSLNFYLNDLIHADGNTALGGISAVADGLSYHDSIEKTFDLNEHMFKNMLLGGDAEDGSLDRKRNLGFKTSVTSNVLTVTVEKTLAEEQADTWLALDAAELTAVYGDTDNADKTGLTIKQEFGENTNQLTNLTGNAIAAGADVLGGDYLAITATDGNGDDFTVQRKYEDLRLTSGSFEGSWRMEFGSHTKGTNKGGFDATVTYNGGLTTNPNHYEVSVANHGFNYVDGDTIVLETVDVITAVGNAAAPGPAAPNGTPDINQTGNTKIGVKGALAGGNTEVVVGTRVSGHAAVPAGTTVTAVIGVDNQNTMVYQISNALTDNIAEDDATLVFGNVTLGQGTFTMQVNGQFQWAPTDLVNWPLSIDDSFTHTTSYTPDGTIVYTANPVLGGVLAGGSNSKTGSLDNSFSSMADVAAPNHYTDQIEGLADSETVMANADRVTCTGGILTGITEFNALGASDLSRANRYYGIKDDNDDWISTDSPQKIPYIGTNRDGDTERPTLIDALLESTSKEDKMWESMLSQLALTSIKQYVPNVDYSATNLIDFGFETQVKTAAGTTSTSSHARGLSESYLGYVSQGGEASTFSEMIRTIGNVAQSDATQELGRQFAATGRHGFAENNNHPVELQNGDKVHLTIQIEVTDADSSSLSGADSISPNFLCFPDATDNAAEESSDVNEAGLAPAAIPAGESSINNLLRVKNGATVIGRIARPKTLGNAALRLRLVCTHQTGNYAAE